jgi:hypothetical protein
MQFTARFD